MEENKKSAMLKHVLNYPLVDSQLKTLILLSLLNQFYYTLFFIISTSAVPEQRSKLQGHKATTHTIF